MKWNVSNVQERGQRRLEWEGVSSVRVGLHEALMWEHSCSEQGSGHKEKDSTWQVQSMADSGHGCMQWGKVDGMVVWIGGSMCCRCIVWWTGANKCSSSCCTCIINALMCACACKLHLKNQSAIYGVQRNWPLGSLHYSFSVRWLLGSGLLQSSGSTAFSPLPCSSNMQPPDSLLWLDWQERKGQPAWHTQWDENKGRDDCRPQSGLSVTGWLRWKDKLENKHKQIFGITIRSHFTY